MLTASCDWCTRGVDCQHLDKQKLEIVHKYLVNKKSFIPFNNSIILYCYCNDRVQKLLWQMDRNVGNPPKSGPKF